MIMWSVRFQALQFGEGGCVVIIVHRLRQRTPKERRTSSPAQKKQKPSRHGHTTCEPRGFLITSSSSSSSSPAST